MIDLSEMKDITVDAERRIARAQTGMKLGEFDRETQKHGLMTPLGVASTTGIGGLTLRRGLRLDGRRARPCLRQRHVARGGQRGRRVIECSAEENPELFCGMRGARHNFGVATQIEYRLHPLRTVYGGPPFYPTDERRGALLRRVRRRCAGSSHLARRVDENARRHPRFRHHCLLSRIGF